MNGCAMSRIKNKAPEIESAQKNRTAITTAFRGEKSHSS